MIEKINKEFLCVLRKSNTNEIMIDYIDIINPFKTLVNNLASLCDKKETTIEEIVNYIQNIKEFDQLTSYYSYCVSLENAFQGFSANNQFFIDEINFLYNLILARKEDDPFTYNHQKEIEKLKSQIKEKYYLWSNAFAINKAYNLCREDKSILIFSHRMHGWSNPIYQLTSNFSVEIKTNFGYGRSSYFYTKLKYKNIDITPFSEWVNYEFSSFSEIIRYTQSYNLKNKYWFDAIVFSRDACNLSLSDEVKFIEEYVINECENMVSGLEEILNREHFTFINRDSKEYSVDKNGHVLVEFRGEKISGALDFIGKILEFEKITDIKTFITRIEQCNKIIQPILVEDAKILKIDVENLNIERNKLQPIYDEVVKINSEYIELKNKLQNDMISKGLLHSNLFDTKKLEIEFTNRYPSYTSFKEEFKEVISKYRILREQIQNKTKVREKIISYNEKIVKYFGETTKIT